MGVLGEGHAVRSAPVARISFTAIPDGNFIDDFEEGSLQGFDPGLGGCAAGAGSRGGWMRPSSDEGGAPAGSMRRFRRQKGQHGRHKRSVTVALTPNGSTIVSAWQSIF